MSVVLPAPQPLSEELERIRSDASVCLDCPLGQTAHTTPLYRGDPSPSVLFVGQSPGREEDELGAPFVGQSGRRLDEKILLGPFPSYGITNAALHHPPGNKWDHGYAFACRHFLLRTIKTVRPKVIVTLGRDAAIAVERLALNIPRFSIVHPSSMNFNPKMRVEWDSGWVKLRMWLSANGVS